MKDITFANPEILYFLIIIPILIIWYIRKQKQRNVDIKVSNIEGFSLSNKSIKPRLIHILFVLRIIAFALIIVALARPQSKTSGKNVKTEGIDIIIAQDISTSMESKDFSPNRLEASKATAQKFIDNRPDDRIGIVVFAAQSFTQCPLTLDHFMLKELLKSVKTRIVDDGTAIGLGLSTAIARIKNSSAKSKVIILLTDGVNNNNEYLSPLDAAELAKELGIRVYTIGVGSEGEFKEPVATPFGTAYQTIRYEIDEQLLKEIAMMTNGKYYRAKSKEALDQIYADIDKLEKTIFEDSFSHTRELFFIFALVASILLFAEFLLKFFYFKTIP